jgi:hypothetical protein
MYDSNADRFHIIRPILERLRDKFPVLYKSKQRLALDEGMLAWRGSSRFQVYKPSEITKLGSMV